MLVIVQADNSQGWRCYCLPSFGVAFSLGFFPPHSHIHSLLQWIFVEWTLLWKKTKCLPSRTVLHLWRSEKPCTMLKVSSAWPVNNWPSYYANLLVKQNDCVPTGCAWWWAAGTNIKDTQCRAQGACNLWKCSQFSPLISVSDLTSGLSSFHLSSYPVMSCTFPCYWILTPTWGE